jgi:tetratricopeptide (TPR) repeat protein
MLPTINKRFLFKVVVVVVALGAGLFGVNLLQARRLPDALKEQAELAVAAAKEDPTKADAAIGALRQYLEFRPDDLDAKEHLVGFLRARHKSGEPTSLLRMYDEILRGDPTRTAVRREAVKLSLKAYRYTDAETHARALLKQVPDDQEGWLDLAYAQRGLQKHPDARESYEAAIKIDPKKAVPYQEYAEFLVNEAKDKDAAKAVLNRMVASLPTDAGALTARGRFLAAVGDEAAAVADARAVLAVAPQNADAMLLLGEQLQKRRDQIQAAADLFRAGMAAHPSDVRFVRNLAWLEVNRGNHGASVAVLEAGMERASEGDSFDLLVPLADLLLQMRDQDGAKKLIAKLAERKETDPVKRRQAELQALYLKGRLAMSEAKWDTAIGHLTDLRTRCGELVGVECQTNLLLSLCHQRKGDFELEEQTLKLLLGRDPNHGAGRVTLGTAYMNAGRFDEALVEFEAASRSRFATASTRAMTLKLKAAGLRARGADKREWADIDAQLAAYEPTFGQATSDYALLRANLFTARGSVDRAIAALREEAIKRPTDARVWSAYALAAADYVGVSMGLSALDEAQALCGDRAELRLARANLYARDPARLRSLDPLAAQIDTWPEVDQNMLLFGLVELYDRLGDEAGVVRTYRRIAGRYPTNATVWEGLFDRATRSGDQKTADEARRMLTKFGGATEKSAALLTAWEVANGRKADQAEAAAAGLVKEFGPKPERAEACVALARLKALTGDPAAAGPLFERAVRLDPDRFGPTQEYITYLTTNGFDDKLTKLLARLTRDHRWFGEPLRRAVRQTVARVEPVAAKRLLDVIRTAVEREPDGYGWLGDSYRSAGFKDEATRCYEVAVERQTATTDDWLRLAIRTAEAGDKPAAVKILDRAKAKFAAQPKLYLMLTAVYADATVAPAGWKPELKSAEERKLYAQARLAVKLSRFQKDEAVMLLEGYLKDDRLPPADASWARRNLAMLLAARGTGNDRTRAKELLTAADGSAGDTPDDKRATAAVLAGLSKQLEGADRDVVLKRAIQVLSEVADQTKSPRDKFLLSQLYRTSASRSTDAGPNENRAKGRKLLNELIATDKTNIEYYVAALDELTEPEDRATAERCAQYLIANHKTEFRVVQAVARFECRVGRPEAALRHIAVYAKTADDTPGDLQLRGTRAAELLDELARQPDVRGTKAGTEMTALAVEKYEGLYAVRPEAVIAIAGLLSADGRSGEAFAKIEKANRLLPSRVKVLAGLAVLRAGGATDGQFKRVREWLDASRTEEPGSTAVLLNEGEFCTLSRDLDGAERAYRAVLETDDQNLVALNNLAWILSARPEAADRALGLIDKAVRQVGLTGELLDTRARVKIAQKQYEAAERDLLLALKQEKTPLRLFHLSMALNAKSPDNGTEARERFREAKKIGLAERNTHPADASVYKDFEKQLGGLN